MPTSYQLEKERVGCHWRVVDDERVLGYVSSYRDAGAKESGFLAVRADAARTRLGVFPTLDAAADAVVNV